MKAEDQQFLTAAAVHEMGVSVPVLWVRYLHIGGTEMQGAVAAYIAGYRILPVVERDLISQAFNDLGGRSPWSPHAPGSHAPLALEQDPKPRT